MKIEETRPPHDENLQQLRRELLERIVRNETRRRTEQNSALASTGKTKEFPAGRNG